MTFSGKLDYWLRFDKFRCTIMDALVKLNALVDESDPDVDIPNMVHAFQTAERIRADHPQEDWFHLTGLIHDLGKVRQSLDPAVLEDVILDWAFFSHTY